MLQDDVGTDNHCAVVERGCTAELRGARYGDRVRGWGGIHDTRPWGQLTDVSIRRYASVLEIPPMPPTLLSIV